MATKQKDAGKDKSKKQKSSRVDPHTCAHGHVRELKDGGRICTACGEELLDPKTQRLCDAIAHAVAREMDKSQGNPAEKEPEEEPEEETLYDRIFGHPANREEEGEEEGDDQK